MADDRSTNFTVNLVDNVSGPLAKIAAEYRQFVEAVRQTNAYFAAVFPDEKAYAKTGDAIKKTTSEMKSLTEVMGSFTKGLIGTFGTVYGVELLAKAVVRLNESRAQLGLFSDATRLTAENIVGTERAMARFGYTSDQTKQQLGNLTSSLKNISTYQYGSQVVQQFRQMGKGGQDLADTLIGLGNNTKGMLDAIEEVWKTAGSQQRTHMATILGVTEEFITKYYEQRKKIEDAPMFITRKEAEERNAALEKYKSTLSDIFELGAARGQRGPTAPRGSPERTRELVARGEYMKAIANELGFGQDDEGAPAAPGAPPAAGAKGSRGGRGPLAAVPGLSLLNRLFGKDDLAESSNRILIDIRDILQRMAGIGGEGDRAGSPTGEGPGATVFRPGRNIPGRGVAPGGVGTGGPGLRTGGANYMQGPLPGEADLVTVQTAAGPMKVNKAAAEDMKGFVDDMVAAGAPVEEIGAYNKRRISGSNRWSQHAYGTALDYGQSSRDVVTKRFRDWSVANKDTLAEIAKRHNMRSGGDWRNPDFGHFEWGGPHGAMSGSPQQGKARGSTFDDRYTASGMASSIPGIALPSREGLGKMFEVTTPDGRKFTVPQTDVGPAAWTKRGIDINRPLANMMGYGGNYPNNFPTDSQFGFRKLDSARDAIDGSGKSKWEGAADISVDFKNVPRGVSTSAEAEGFKTLRVTKTRQAGDADGIKPDYVYE